MFYYYGAKRMFARQWGRPTRPLIVEPFAGSASYAMHWLHAVDEVRLVEKDARVVELWRRLLAMEPEEVLALEPPEAGVYTEDFLWMTAATSNAIANVYRLKMPERVPRVAKLMLAGIAERLPEAKRKVTIVHGDYTDAGDDEATWFIDPPYQVNGNGSARTAYPQGMGYSRREKCTAARLDFEKLADWCRSRRGQVMVCEQRGAAWLPFVPLRRNGPEVGWRNDDSVGTLLGDSSGGVKEVPFLSNIHTVAQHAGALRQAQAQGYRVVVAIRDADMPFVEGQCSYVATSDAYAIVGDYHVPLDRVIRVTRHQR